MDKHKWQPERPTLEYLQMAEGHLRDYFLLSDFTAKRDKADAALSVISQAIRELRASLPSPAPQPTYPLNVEGLKKLADEWAKDDRLWTTQETVAFNLATFGRKVLALKEKSDAE